MQLTQLQGGMDLAKIRISKTPMIAHCAGRTRAYHGVAGWQVGPGPTVNLFFYYRLPSPFPLFPHAPPALPSRWHLGVGLLGRAAAVSGVRVAGVVRTPLRAMGRSALLADSLPNIGTGGPCPLNTDLGL